MVLYNSSSRARNTALTVNQNQGGGNKKAGLSQTVGKGQWESIYIKNVSVTTLNDFTMFPGTRNISRPIGRSGISSYFRMF